MTYWWLGMIAAIVLGTWLVVSPGGRSPIVNYFLGNALAWVGFIGLIVLAIVQLTLWFGG